MAEHMQAVKTIWTLEWRSQSGIFHRDIIEKSHQISQMLIFLHSKGISSAKLTETRTCDAMPGLAYTKNHMIDIAIYIEA